MINSILKQSMINNILKETISNSLKQSLIDNISKQSMINNILKEQTIDNNLKESLINDILKESTINNNLEESTINNNLEESTDNDSKKSTKNNSKKSTKNDLTSNSTFIKTPEWLRLKRSVLNPNNKDNKCFQYSTTLSLYHKQIGKIFSRIINIKPLINNVNWENFPRKIQDYQQLEMNNESITLNILEVDDEQQISHIYNSQHNKTRENKVILLILDDKHYVAVKNLNSLLKDKNECSKDFCINFLKPFSTKLKLKKTSRRLLIIVIIRI